MKKTKRVGPQVVPILSATIEVVEEMLRGDVRVATKYLSPTLTVRASRRRVNGRVPRRGSVDVVLTIGRPNHAARAFARAAKKAGEPFPVRKVQIVPAR